MCKISFESDDAVYIRFALRTVLNNVDNMSSLDRFTLLDLLDRLDKYLEGK